MPPAPAGGENGTNMILQTHKKEYAVEWPLLLIGCVIYALSTALIRDVAVIPGSFLGVGVALNKAIGWPTGLINLALNIPVMLLVTRKLGVKVLAYTVFILAFTALLIDWWSPIFPSVGWNVYLLAAVGGVSMGVGAGLLILAQGTMAGTTALTLLVVRALKERFHFGTVLFCMDSLIVLLGALIVKDWRAILYSLLYSFCCAKTMDLIIGIGHKFGLAEAGRTEHTETNQIGEE